MKKKQIILCIAAVICALLIFVAAVWRMQSKTAAVPPESDTASIASTSISSQSEIPSSVPEKDESNLPIGPAPSGVVMSSDSSSGSKATSSTSAANSTSSTKASSEPVNPAPSSSKTASSSQSQTPAPPPASSSQAQVQPTPTPTPPAPVVEHYHGNGSDAGTCPNCGLGYSPFVDTDTPGGGMDAGDLS